MSGPTLNTPWHILIIEHNPEDRADIRRMLLHGSERRLRFTETQLGSAGVRACREPTGSPPDCVLLDFNLPDMDAYEVLADLRAGAEFPRYPVVVLTGSNREAGPYLLRAGAQDYIGKSWATPESLTRAIENAIERFSLIAERTQAERDLSSSEVLRIKAGRLAEQNAEIEQARHALEEKATELALASKYKSEFLANMSHELRTPLNSILIFSQQLAGNTAGNLTAKQVEFSRHINSSGTDLLHLIDDILDLSKIESGTVTVLAEEIPFAGLRDNITRNFGHVAQAKKLPLLVKFAADLPRFMESDPKRLQQILQNLLSNAVKFTTHGHVQIQVSFATRGWSLDHPVLSGARQVVAFAVEDTGIGVATEKQRLIFEAFQQADAGTARKYGGTGLGLAISRELAALLGGEIKLASVYGQGSTFTLFLPLLYSGPQGTRTTPATSLVREGVAAEALAARAISPDIFPPGMNGFELLEKVHAEKPRMLERLPRPNEALRGRKVLVVDDDARNIFALTSLLEDQEMEVISTTNGRGAIHLIEHTPELSMVLMDIMMPDMDGYETIREIRQCAEFHTLPILALTAKAMKGDREKCLGAGASAYIAKPVNTGQLLSLMRVWLSQ